MIRRVLGIRWFDKVSNEELYASCGIAPASVQCLHARWRLFGHVLRMDASTPARQAMLSYFQKGFPGSLVILQLLLLFFLVS